MGGSEPDRWIVAQIGARRHYAVPRAFSGAGMLACLYTELHAGHPLARLMSTTLPAAFRPKSVQSVLARSIDGVQPNLIRTLPWFTLRRLLDRSKNEGPGDSYRRWVTANQSFNRSVVATAFPDASGVYVFNGAGLEILERARSLGLRTIVDQTDAPFEIEERLLDEERQRWPNWERGGIERSDWEPMAARERAEWDLADAIFCGSDYVSEGVAYAGGPAERCRVIPYGFGTAPALAPRDRTAVQSNRELRVLFAGTVCLRKGIQYLGEAARLLNARNIRIRAVGTSALAESAIDSLKKQIELVGSVPRTQMAEQYAWADVVVLPSISEGSANVCYEALAHGVPVITTPNSGSVVRDEREGYIVPIRDADSLADRISRLANDRQLLRAMSDAAVERALEFTWEKYATRLTAAVRDCKQPTKPIRVSQTVIAAWATHL